MFCFLDIDQFLSSCPFLRSLPTRGCYGYRACHKQYADDQRLSPFRASQLMIIDDWGFGACVGLEVQGVGIRDLSV